MVTPSRGGRRRGTQGTNSHSDRHCGEEARSCRRNRHHRECSFDLVAVGVGAVVGSSKAIDIFGVDWRCRDRRQCTDRWSGREGSRMHRMRLGVSIGLGTAGESELSGTTFHLQCDRNFVRAPRVVRIERTRDTATVQARRHSEAVHCIVGTA